MFVQVMQGQVEDSAALRAHWKQSEQDLRSTGDGYLGSTAGVDENGRFVAMVRFASETAALRLAASAPEGAWWDRAADHLSGLTFEETSRTDIWNRGGSDQAGFVQIRQGVSSDPERLRDLYVNQQPVRMGPYRPEVLGGLFAWHGDTGFTLSAYFTSEQEARSGEHLDAFASFFADIDAVMQDLVYTDLRQPWLSAGTASPSRLATASG